MVKKCLVLFSGGLDSRLAIKLMQKKGFKVIAVYFKLPFIKREEEQIREFSKKHKVELKIIDCTKGKLLQDYLEIIKKANHGRGKGYNPCIDCKIFMYKEVTKIAKENRIKDIATGNVAGQRPMSQKQKQMKIIEKESKIKSIHHPLMELGIRGRQRKKQIELANKLDVSYPNPAGGCLLCEKDLKKRFSYLIQRGLKSKEIILINSGRHFILDGNWVILGRNKEENEFLEQAKTGNLITSEKINVIGPSAIILDKPTKKTEELTKKLIFAYSQKGSKEDKKEFEKYKI